MLLHCCLWVCLLASYTAPVVTLAQHVPEQKYIFSHRVPSSTDANMREKMREENSKFYYSTYMLQHRSIWCWSFSCVVAAIEMVRCMARRSELRQHVLEERRRRLLSLAKID